MGMSDGKVQVQKGVITKIGNWVDYHSSAIFTAGVITVIGGVMYGFGSMIYHSGEVRSERVVETLPIGQGNNVVTYHRNIKFFDDNYRWEMRDRDERVFLRGDGTVAIDKTYFVLKSDSLSNELERKVSGTATEE